MGTSPLFPESFAWQCGGRILVGGNDRGAGVAVGPRLVLTAQHVVVSKQSDAPIAFRTFDGHVARVNPPIRLADGLDAAALDLAEDVAWSLVAKAREGGRWFVKPTGVSNDPVLTGTVTATGLPIIDAKGNEVTAIQLQVEQDLGGFKGYSGSAVLNDDRHAIALLIEQKVRRVNALHPPASNVLFALPMADVAKNLQINVSVPSPIQAPPSLPLEGVGRIVDQLLLAGDLANPAVLHNFLSLLPIDILGILPYSPQSRTLLVNVVRKCHRAGVRGRRALVDALGLAMPEVELADVLRVLDDEWPSQP